MQALINTRVPTRDGVELATDVWRPDGPGPWPVVLVRTPYHRQGGSAQGAYFSDRGYVFVIQDTRGKYDSDGEFRPLDDEEADGQDTLDWVANQTWCNGRIGMVGRSYLGIVQIPAAAGGHEALRCIVPGVAPNSFFVDWIRYDGCLALANMIRWPLEHSVCRTKPFTGHFSWDDVWRLGVMGHLSDVEARVGFASAQLRRWVEHDQYDDYWASIDQAAMYPRVACPGLHQAGFFDHLSRAQFSAFKTIRTEGTGERARAGQRLLVGPWGHSSCAQSTYGEWDFGARAGIDFTAYQQRFLDLWLKDIDDGISEEPAVRYFLMGENRWEGASEWPPPEAVTQPWYLDSRDGALGLGSTGQLTREVPSVSTADPYVYDPADPVPTVGGQVYWGMSDIAKVGPAEQRGILSRDDVLLYRSEVLANPVRVVGAVNLDLWISSSASDTDFVAKLCVMEALGSIVCVCLGSIRCRYRESWSQPTPLQPNEATNIRLQMNNIAYTFPTGSRIVLLVTSSCCPRILPHRNTMAPAWQERSPQTATQQVLHGPDHPSRLLLSVLPE